MKNQSGLAILATVVSCVLALVTFLVTAAGGLWIPSIVVAIVALGMSVLWGKGGLKVALIAVNAVVLVYLLAPFLLS
ncbi:hypothetical protein [Neisseria chenwenguii]|uniref:Uncharacterized protein n=1 Tax=Neisseria chenwenguii TaxID=1853278 RepID=A0A220S238_9NEIS|nr:hypothetical protein [Neisseria chenwenguii]ASK27255.1 hypothetical protein BG910_05420 [Neisseria chenwenguii]ROV53855.1 hypothetical protein EGS38_11730 [Neisseria chenwenguii]